MGGESLGHVFALAAAAAAMKMMEMHFGCTCVPVRVRERVLMLQRYGAPAPRVPAPVAAGWSYSYCATRSRCHQGVHIAQEQGRPGCWVPLRLVCLGGHWEHLPRSRRDLDVTAASSSPLLCRTYTSLFLALSPPPAPSPSLSRCGEAG